MVFTDLPAAIFLILIRSSPLTFLILRACSQNMNIAQRSAFLVYSNPADKCTAVMGTFGVTNTFFQSLGPLLAKRLAGNEKLALGY